MANKQIGDRVKSTTYDGQDGHKVQSVLEGTILEIDYNGIGEAIHALVKQDDGKTVWWGL